MSISPDRVSDLRKAFEGNDQLRAAQNAVTRHDVRKLVTDHSKLVSDTQHVFSHRADHPNMKITAQKSSGRCWLFAALNVIRRHMVTMHKLPASFELSQSYCFFWDKFEKANFFLQSIIKTRHMSEDSRLVSYLLKSPVQDGGQYQMFANLVNKYGLVPKDAYPESASSTMSRPLNWLLTHRLRRMACVLRQLHTDGHGLEQLKDRASGFVKEVFDVLCVHLGTPPSTFDWKFYTKDKTFRKYSKLTPQEFYKTHVPFDVNDYVSVVNDPRNKYNQLLTVDYLQNVQGGDPVQYINVSSQELQNLVCRSICVHKQPVWFGCDVGKFLDREHGIMDTDLFKYDALVGTELTDEKGELTFTKAERLRYGESLMTHAMVFTAVDLTDVEDSPSPSELEKKDKKADKKDKDEENGESKKECDDPSKQYRVNMYQVENSWGKDRGNQGFYVATSRWFDQFVYQICVPKSLLAQDTLKVLEQMPVVLDAWDPMGSLAN